MALIASVWPTKQDQIKKTLFILFYNVCKTKMMHFKKYWFSKYIAYLSGFRENKLFYLNHSISLHTISENNTDISPFPPHISLFWSLHQHPTPHLNLSHTLSFLFVCSVSLSRYPPDNSCHALIGWLSGGGGNMWPVVISCLPAWNKPFSYSSDSWCNTCLVCP